jgi:hypothetical protein
LFDEKVRRSGGGTVKRFFRARIPTKVASDRIHRFRGRHNVDLFESIAISVFESAERVELERSRKGLERF